MRLIDADAAKLALIGWDTDPTDEEIEYTIDNIPTIDAVPVVRCKDCKNYGTGIDPHGKTVGYCKLHRGLVMVGENTFCSYGERKKDAD